MKIIIDIPEEVFDEIYNKNYYSLKGKEALRVAVRNGTPLPKGHGKLKDVDAIKPINAPIAPLTPEDSVHYELIYMKSEIDRAPTIIEADKEGEQE